MVPIGDDTYWQTTSRGMVPERPFWGTLRPLLSNGGEVSSCEQPFDLAFATFPGTAFHRQMDEVAWAVENLTPEQAEMAEFWGYSEPQTTTMLATEEAVQGNAMTHWMLIAAQVSEEQQLSLADASRLYATIGLAVHDAMIQIWQSKYETFLLRPQTYINEFMDARWQPYLTTPDSPSYPSASAAVGAATAEILTTYLGYTSFVDAVGVVYGESTSRHFTTFEEAAYEAGMAELYAGSNMRSAIEAGLRQGRCMGQAVVASNRPSVAQTRDK